jgi:hypothetical protein
LEFKRTWGIREELQVPYLRGPREGWILLSDVCMIPLIDLAQ